MRSPARPLPEEILLWTRRARWLRWADGLGAWLGLWLVVAAIAPQLAGRAAAVVAGLCVAAVALLPPVRERWRPVSGPVALAMSRSLRPGDRAWYVYPGGAEIALVTGRRGRRITIARRTRGPEEAIAVWRSRVLLVPADRDPG